MSQERGVHSRWMPKQHCLSWSGRCVPAVNFMISLLDRNNLARGHIANFTLSRISMVKTWLFAAGCFLQ
jgi:hypothetical protein